MSGALRTLAQLAYQVSPIILTGGIATPLPGGALPIIFLTESVALVGGLLTGAGLPSSLDDFFAQYLPISGGTLIDQQIGNYPFANQMIAANAVIQQPLKISLQMIAPSRQSGDMLTKLPIMTLVQSALAQHNATGGLYTIATSAYVYTNCLMTGFTDITPSSDYKQWQIIWQLDFQQPLVTQAQATNTFNALLSNINNGGVVGQGTAAWGNPLTTINNAAQGALNYLTSIGKGILADIQSALGNS